MTSKHYIVQNDVTGKIAEAMRWSNGKIESLHLFVTKKAAKGLARHLNVGHVNPRYPWKVKPVTLRIWNKV